MPAVNEPSPQKERVGGRRLFGSGFLRVLAVAVFFFAAALVLFWMLADAGVDFSVVWHPGRWRGSQGASKLEEKADEQWLCAEEKWLTQERQALRRERKWLLENRTAEVDAWIWEAEVQRRSRKQSSPVLWWVHGDAEPEDDEVREWVRRNEEAYRKLQIWSERLSVWRKKGGDAGELLDGPQRRLTPGPLSRASASVAPPLDRADDRWLQVEEEWLKKEMEWSVPEDEWLDRHRTKAGDEGRAYVTAREEERREREGLPFSAAELRAARWNYRGDDEELREWLERQKELYRRIRVWDERVAVWIQEGGDASKPAEWEQEVRRRLGGDLEEEGERR